jgi:hypothetical protein
MDPPPAPAPPPPPSGGGKLTYGEAHPLVRRITALRTRVRTVVGLYGLGILLSTAVGTLLLLMVGDYLFHMPAALRLVLLVSLVAVLGFFIWRFLIAPLSTRLTDQFLASRVENVNKDLADELMSAIQFIHTRAGATNALAARHIDLASKKVATLRFEEAIDFRQAGKALGIAALIIVIAGLVGALNPSLARIAFSRWFSPNPLPWPHYTHVSFEWPGGNIPSVLPLGEKVTIRAKVDQGSLPRVWLYSKTDKENRTTRQLMTYQKEQSSSNQFIYESSLEPDGRTLTLHIEAGDDTEEPPVTLTLAPRPIITALAASITPPAYVKNVQDPSKPVPAVVVDLLSQVGRAVEGASVSLRVKATKPFLTAADGHPDIRLLDQNKDEELPITLATKLVDAQTAQVDFPAAKTFQGRLVMRDADHFENHVGGTLTLEVMPDALPSIVITDPRRSVERSPTGTIEITLQATDDLGLDGLKLRAEKYDAKPGDPPAFDIDLPWSERIADAAVGSTTGKAKYAWDLAPLKLQPGARLSFYAMVQDNYDVNGKRHDWVKSAPLSVQVRSDADIIEDARRNLNEVKDRIRNLRGQQDQTRTFTDAIRKSVAASGVTTLQQKTQLADLALQQSQESASANSIQQRTEQIADDLRQNKMGEGDLGKLAQEVAAGMQSVGSSDMPKAAGELNRAQESAGNRNDDPARSRSQAQESAAAMAGANKQQEQALATMDDLINRLGATGDFENLRNQASNLLKQQEKLANDTRQLAPQTLGKNPQDLPQQLRDKANQLSSQQKELANQTTALIDQMNKTATQLQPTDAASAQSLQKAAEAGTQAQVSSAQSSAASDLSSNQMSSAANGQAQAQRGLQNMLDELDKRQRIALEQLARQLRALLDEVKRLRADQDAINKETVTAGATPAAALMQKLGDRQGTLQQNTIVTQKKAENTPRAKEAASDLHDASEAMSTAAGLLYGSKQPDALDPENKSLAALDEAIKKLEAATKKTEAEVKDKDLAEYIKQYEAIKTDQVAVKGTTDKIETKRQAAADKQVDRIDMIRLAELAKTQGGLSERVSALSTDDKLKAFDVVVWMNGQITELMNLSRDRLGKTQLGTQTASAQQGSIDRLEMVIDALKEEQKRNSDFQSPQGGGGGGGGKPPLVPPLAQLKLLKAMQSVINTETTAIGKGLSTAAGPDKNQMLDEAARLGQKQGEIKEIADKLGKALTR